MVKASILKNLLCDNESLNIYNNGDLVTIDDIKRKLFLLERAENKKIPDHHYQLLKEKEVGQFDSIDSLLSLGLGGLANTYLELREKKIYVKHDKQTDWQQLLTYIPPLVLQTAFLASKTNFDTISPKEIITYFKDNILYNFQFTALPYPFIPQLELYMREQKGLHDLHMHLNGSTETDVTWQDFLNNPDRIQANLQYGYDNSAKVKEQLEQESPLLNPTKFCVLLKVAQRIRFVLFDYIFPTSSEPYKGLASKEKILDTILNDTSPKIYGNYEHPFKQLVNVRAEYPHLMAIEALMYVLVFDYLKKQSNTIVAPLFHFYLLILGLSNRLLVQQAHQNGFDQFQKNTLNGLRWFSESEFERRFCQLSGNELRNLKFLEGRFAPQNSTIDLIKLLKDIEKGWAALIKLLKENNKPLIEKDEEVIFPQLKLTAHFIKGEDRHINEFIRHNRLRIETWKKGDTLIKLLENNDSYKKLVTAADAASNELEAPPEVFSPVFTMLRKKGIKHFTYHAGEDFFHLFSGMRAVYEAIEFNEFQCGDRIGHATATGLDAQLWLNNMGKKILIRRGEWLDNLVFIYHLIVKKKIIGLKKHIPFIVNQVQELYFEVYRDHHSIAMLEKAWLMRKHCPFHLTDVLRDTALRSDVYNDDIWDSLKEIRKDELSVKIYSQYHNRINRTRYNEPIEIDLTEFSAADIKELQLAVLKYMHEKEIVIETLPTSNVRIGHHEDYTTHQLWNWLNWEIEGHPIPPIVMGSDDTGIFATSIYNEYANLYCCATQELGYNHNKTMAIIERLDRNGRIYRFD